MKTALALAAIVAVIAAPSTASACDRHASTTAQAAIVAPPPAAPRPIAEDELVLPQSKPELATSSIRPMGDCTRGREQTVYLTQ
jgi:hypothetical protein